MGDVTDLTAVSSRDLRVGISISEPADAELISLGLSELHVRHGFIEVVRHVLAAGWSIAYGGDFRPRGYTQALLDLVRTYERTALSGPDHVFSYLAWPRFSELDDANRAELANIATIVAVAPPPGAPEGLPPLDQQQPADRLWNVRALTRMREQMIGDLDAVVILGGRVSGQQGLLPGVLEEAALALAGGVPVFVAGGFGGAAGAIARALDGGSTETLAVDFQLANTDGYAEILELAGPAGLAPDFDAITADLRGRGLAGLNNALDETENRRLALTDEVDEVIVLVLRGLFRLAGDTSS